MDKFSQTHKTPETRVGVLHSLSGTMAAFPTAQKSYGKRVNKKGKVP